MLNFMTLNAKRMTDDLQFSACYRLTFLLSRDKGCNTLDSKKAAIAWNALLQGRFTLLNAWCEFVMAQRKFITEDTWRQVLDFCKLSRDGLTGYDPSGAWPVLIDEFVENMLSKEDGTILYEDADSDTCMGSDMKGSRDSKEDWLSDCSNDTRNDSACINKRKSSSRHVSMDDDFESVDDIVVRMKRMDSGESDDRNRKIPRLKQDDA